MRSVTLALAAALLAPCAALGAQTAPLSPGTRVRLTTPSRPHARQVGTLLALKADSIHLRRDGQADSLSIPIAQVTGIEVSSGLRTQGRRGMGIGFLAGAGFGVMIGLADGDEPPGSIIQLSAAEKAMLAGSLLGVAGAVVGGVVGLASRTETWRPVRLADLSGRVGVAPRGGGLALEVVLRF